MRVILWCVVLLLGFCQFAEAYVDPGVGNFLFQVVLAALLTAAVIMRNLWTRSVGILQRLIRRKRHPPRDAS